MSAVEQKMTSSDERKILQFIENQDNIFSKIENNINQFAKIANAKKNIFPKEMIAFLEKLEEIKQLKTKQNEIFKAIYKMLENDSEDFKFGK